MMESWAVEFPQKSVRMALVLVKKKNVFLAEEWVTSGVHVSGVNDKRDSKLSMLRGKIRKHVNSRAHEIANEIIESQKTDSISGAVRKLENEEIRKTEIVFRTVYYLAKNNRPFSDHPALIDLQKLNGLDCGMIYMIYIHVTVQQQSSTV